MHPAHPLCTRTGFHLPQWVRAWVMPMAMCGGMALALGGCARSPFPDAGAPMMADAPEGTLRVQVRLTAARPVDDRLARDLAQDSGLGVQHIQAISDRLLRVDFVCAQPEACEQGLARLRARHDWVEDVTPEGRAARPRQPTRPQERS